ncbi:tetratricopeptide repeat protein [Pseudoduganella sp. LjRoot289]|uniref:tetratricopeptide repeat protein n=1 Tax=Pseudoduganella sp. LjRoot289 TaxID=3342314 RepID=UPI003ECDC757
MKHSKSKQKISLDDALQLAVAVHREGKPRLAAQHYTAILEIDPKHPDALHYMGVAQHQLGNHDGAVNLISRALEVAPDYVDARNNLGNVQKEMGRNADAEQSYRAVIAARPDFALAHNNLGVVLRAQDKLGEAADAYRQAVTLAPKFAQGWLNLGNVLKKSGDFNEALSAYRNGLLLAPENPDAYRSLARALVAQQRHKEALEIYRQWEKIDPANPVVQHHIAACEGAAVPERASDAYVQTVFDRFANSFEQVLAKLEYRAPALCGEMVASLLGEPDDAQRALDVLDAGCGTGLCGPLLRPYAKRLEGVDLSAGMLAKAAERGDYDQLHEAELTAWLSGRPAAYDMLVSADTLCYFGALEAVMRAAAAAVRPGGYLVFTVEATQDAAAAPRFLLHPHGRYSHTEAYVRAALAAAGLEVTQLRHITLRQEASKPVAGLLVGARKP